ncbi:MAG: bifunctional molybdenum cofactor biosynthesis protein MoaC/MoaB [Deltaproteobacteria bacterium]|nr:bifunctional molybdenum cofactor biosynthesis protein MoaC/MoaB [Deltaproteobacteria bacterium]
MFSTAHKISTLRTAKAQAVLRLTPQLVEALRSKSGPKGDALEIARAAGVLAAKRTWELIPYCHPIPIDQVLIHCELEENSARITSEVTSVGKTGIEMEALVAAQIAATTIFDMLKPLSAEMEITDVKVLKKEGGKSSFQEMLPKGFKAAVIVTSDGTFAGKREDRSGKIIKERLEKFGISGVDYLILPDEKEKIQQALLDFHKKDFSLVVTTGGTGLGPRDVTVEATEGILDREVPGIMEAARSFGQQRTPYSMLSRGRAGLKGGMLIVNLPGSSKGTAESLDAIFPAILHSYRMMAGGKHD